MTDFTERLIGIGGTVLVVFALALLVDVLIRRAGRRVALLAHLSLRTRLPFRALAVSAATAVGLSLFAPPGAWPTVRHLVGLVVIATVAWLAASLLLVLEDSALPRWRVDVQDNRHARGIRTQLIILRRVTVFVVTVFAIGAALMTFQNVRLVGTSVLASAGVIAAIAAFATNTLLGNIVAGVQIAFSGSLRLDDVVVVEGEWGRVEEITLTYVVVHVWDDRRLVLPSSYFTTKPFENWTHTSSELTGEVLIDVDVDVDLADLRSRLRSLVDADGRWDGRVCVAQVVDATDGRVRVRALVSARDAPTLWDLRCWVREGLVAWMNESAGEPRSRTTVRLHDPAPTESGSSCTEDGAAPRQRVTE